MVRTSGGSLSSVCLLSARAHARLVLREIRVGFDFENLLGMPLTVRRNEQHDLISVELAHGAVAHVVAQPGGALHEIFRGSAAFEEVLPRAFRRTEAVGGDQGLRRL